MERRRCEGSVVAVRSGPRATNATPSPLDLLADREPKSPAMTLKEREPVHEATRRKTDRTIGL